MPGQTLGEFGSAVRRWDSLRDSFATPGQMPIEFGSAVRRWDSLRESFATPGQMPGQFGSAIRRMQRETPGQVISDRHTR